VVPRCLNRVPHDLLQTQAEVEEQQERIKKRRRESAQRSRARKNTYMKSLEVRGFDAGSCRGGSGVRAS